MTHGARSVFLNVPFDKPYEPVFIGLVGALVYLGKNPRTVLDLAGGAATRMNRLINAIRESPFSVHDLSRVQISGRGAGAVPRFNMPFELGLAVVVSLSERQKPRHGFVVLESRRFRLQLSLSDMNGYDPLIHSGSQHGGIRAMFDAFAGERTADLKAAQRLVGRLSQVAGRLKRAHHTATVFNRLLCRDLIGAAIRLRNR